MSFNASILIKYDMDLQPEADDMWWRNFESLNAYPIW